eukprot:PITA_26554
MDKVVEYKDIFASPTGVPLHCQVKHSIDLTLGAPLPNGPIYRRSVLENDEIKRQILELLQKGHIRPSSSPCESSIVLVLQTLRQHKLCANLEKSTFGLTQVQYLGYIIDEEGVHVDPSKLQVIQDWPAPTTLTELRSFLGLANFYHKLMLGFSHILWPLSQVTKGGAKEKFFWSETQQRAFSELKNRLCSKPVLTLPDLQQPFEIETDASDYAIGAVLTQHGI